MSFELACHYRVYCCQMYREQAFQHPVYRGFYRLRAYHSQSDRRQVYQPQASQLQGYRHPLYLYPVCRHRNYLCRACHLG